MSTIEVVPAKIQKFQNFGNTIFVSADNNQKGAVINRYPPTNTVACSPNKPLTYAPNTNLQFCINTGEGILSPNQSYFSYTVQFALKVCFPYNQGGKTPADNIRRYFVQNRDGYGPYWYFERYIWHEPTVSWQSAGKKPIAFMAFACNSTVIFDKTEFRHKGLTSMDPQISRKTGLKQMELTNDFQNAQNQTWFSGDKPVIDFVAVPYKYTTAGDRRTKKFIDIADLAYFDDTSIPKNEVIKGAKPTNAADSQVIFLFNKTFTTPLNILNQMFDGELVFPLVVIGGQEIQFDLYLAHEYMYKLFGTSDYLDKTLTGIISMEMVLVTKESEVVKTELNEKGYITHTYKRYDYALMPTDNVYSQTNRMIYSGHDSTASMCTGLSLNDKNCDDSLYLKQRFTLFSAEQQLNIINGVYDFNEEFNWFKYFNLWKGSRSNAVFSSNLENIIQFKCENLRGLTLYNQYSFGANHFDSQLKLMMNWAVMNINLQSYAIDTNDDVVNDGMNTIDQKLMLDYQLGLSLNGSETQVYNPLTQSPKTLIDAGTPVQVEVIQFYDSVIQFDVKEKKVLQDDNYIQNHINQQK
ncbi:Conserved_hypothetical protein [Hexamita inflata]|uniref:Capsid protein n=2 Tax=Hexamita inflata TaxID=28002 RepID=A0AA86Q7V7_9EUKA|nr:Conserved hypothetical protein [Hexamita inflata]